MLTDTFHRRFAFLSGDAAEDSLLKVRSFEVILLLLLLTEYWARAIPKWGLVAPAYEVTLGLATLLCPLGLYVPFRRWVFLGLAALHAHLIWLEFPAAGNHAYFECMLLTLAAGLDSRLEADRELFLRAVRWLVILIMFWSGVQKLVHGYWTQGQYLAFSLWIESFRPVLAPLLSGEDFARLSAYTRQVGDGPYLAGTAWLGAVSLATCWAEILVAPLLALRRTRVVGVVITLGLLAAIQSGARELFFGLLMTSSLLLFLPSNAIRRAVPVMATVFGLLMLSRLGILPEMTFY